MATVVSLFKILAGALSDSLEKENHRIFTISDRPDTIDCV